jgi:uncharacterized protein YigE (DUF2233 family)
MVHGTSDSLPSRLPRRRARAPRVACLRAAAVAGFALALLPGAAGAVDARAWAHGGHAYHVVELDLARDVLELRWHDDQGHALGSIEALRDWGARHGRELEFATNAGIYDRELRPLGLHIEGGATLRGLNTAPGAGRSGNFSLQPNGVFFIDQAGRAGVLPTSAWRERRIDARLATQSGPMLVIDGAINPAFDPASASLKWRSGVCAPAPARVVFAVSEEPVSFDAFAHALRDGLGCRDALFLDGTLSRIWTRTDGYAGAPAVMVKPYAGMLAVFGRAADEARKPAEPAARR